MGKRGREGEDGVRPENQPNGDSSLSSWSQPWHSLGRTSGPETSALVNGNSGHRTKQFLSCFSPPPPPKEDLRYSGI